MKYRVLIEPDALHDMEMIFSWTCEAFGKKQAAQYQATLKKALRSLAELPERGPVAPEAVHLGETVRQKTHHPFRVLYVIRKHVIHVLHIRHAARLPMGAAERG